VPRKSVIVISARAWLQHGARLPQTERGDHPLDAVEGPDRHPVARLDVGREEGGAER
jgi:hypothetical protein